MDTLDLTKFDPTVAELNALVEKTSTVIVKDLTDKNAIAEVKKNRIELRDARVKITKRGKELRDDANKFAKAVIEKEKELVAIITPEEQRLQSIEDESAELIETEKRKADLPARLEKLSTIGDGVEISDEEILKMDSFAFDVYVNSRKAALMDKQREELEQREREVKEAELKVQREKELKEAEEKARIEEREKLEREKKEQEQREKEEREKLEKEKEYQNFLSENGYSEKTKTEFKIVNEGSEVKLYKLVATYTQK